MPLLPAAIAAYILVNAVSFAAFRRDKKLAGRAAWRTPERRLLLLAFFGPLGALAAMRVFRHKTQKPIFLVVLIIASIIWGVIAVWSILGR